MKKLVSALMVTVMVAGFSMPVYACTPSLKTPSVEIPDINFKADGALGDAIDNAVKNWIEKCVLEKPTVNYATYFKSTSRYFNYAVFSANWNKVENATSYKVRVTKTDGSYKEFDTTHTSFYSTNYNDDFIADGMDGATVSVKAYGDNDTFGCWSETTAITRFGY